MNLKERKTGFIAADQAINAYLKDINRYKVLSAAEEAELVKKMREGDESAREKLTTANLRFVYAVAKRYANSDNLLDLVQEGNTGLITALNAFDPEKGTRFLSCAVWYITRSILAHINGENALIRKTNNTKTVYKIPKIKEKFYAENNRYPDADELAAILEADYGLKIKDKTDLLDVSTTSISTCFDDEDSRAFENTPYFSEKTAVDNDYMPEMDKEFNSVVSGALMSSLTEREQTIVKMAFGIGYNKEYTNAEIADEIGMSSERVRQLKNGAIEKMRKLAVAEHLSF
jgi:RNA polymerase primary sigma factor